MRERISSLKTLVTGIKKKLGFSKPKTAFFKVSRVCPPELALRGLLARASGLGRSSRRAAGGAAAPGAVRGRGRGRCTAVSSARGAAGGRTRGNHELKMQTRAAAGGGPALAPGSTSCWSSPQRPAPRAGPGRRQHSCSAASVHLIVLLFLRWFHCFVFKNNSGCGTTRTAAGAQLRAATCGRAGWPARRRAGRRRWCALGWRTWGSRCGESGAESGAGPERGAVSAGRSQGWGGVGGGAESQRRAELVFQSRQHTHRPHRSLPVPSPIPHRWQPREGRGGRALCLTWSH